MLKLFRKIIVSLFATALTVCALWAAGLIWYSALIFTAAPQAMEQKVDALIVLTGGQNRIVEGVRLLDDKNAEKLFISGVHQGIRVETLTGPNPPCCITLGYEAGNTNENALESARWAADENISSVRLITSDYHMPRAHLEFKHHMHKDAQILKHPVKAGKHSLFSEQFMTLVFEEYHKYLATWIRLHVSPPEEEAS